VPYQQPVQTFSKQQIHPKEACQANNGGQKSRYFIGGKWLGVSG